MALADYCRCDVCGSKAFYDATITDSRYVALYDETEDTDPIALAVLCPECAKTRSVAVLPEGMTVADLETNWRDISTYDFNSDTEILVCGQDGCAVAFWDDEDDEFVTDLRGKGNGQAVYGVTRWMPIPK